MVGGVHVSSIAKLLNDVALVVSVLVGVVDPEVRVRCVSADAAANSSIEVSMVFSSKSVLRFIA